MEIRENVSLKDKNWFETGGNARYFCEPSSEDDFKEALEFARDKNLDIFFLGDGANILISDEGFDGLVIHPQNNQISVTEEIGEVAIVEAGAGAEIQAVIDYCLDHQLIGLEDFSAIPGNIGGAVYINIHYFKSLLSNFLVNARVIHKNTLEILDVDNNWFEFGYDKSKLFEGNYYLVSAKFKLQKVDEIEASYNKGRRDEIINHRHSKYPYKGTCGSFFRNFHEDEVTLKINGTKAIWVAYYLDKLGIKGELKVGDAIVSPKHANMIENLGNASSSDIISLVRMMQEKVKNEFGILPVAECQLIGFKEYPLLRV